MAGGGLLLLIAGVAAIAIPSVLSARRERAE
jgi:hypothetical protein